jgi:HAD superfamily hydrolase (TIGR01490 family)
MRAMGCMAKYNVSLIDLLLVASRLSGERAGRLEREFADTCRKWVEKDVLPLVVPGAREKIEKHRAEGHVLAILSTSPNYVTEPLAEVLGIDEVMSTRFEVDGGHFTGRLLGPACVGKGKVHWAEDLGARRELDLSQSWFYTDSYTDMPMLERVGNRVVVNPDPRLKRIAKRRGWPVQDWRQASIAAEVRA